MNVIFEASELIEIKVKCSRFQIKPNTLQEEPSKWVGSYTSISTKGELQQNVIKLAAVSKPLNQLKRKLLFLNPN